MKKLNSIIIVCFLEAVFCSCGKVLKHMDEKLAESKELFAEESRDAAADADTEDKYLLGDIKGKSATSVSGLEIPAKLTQTSEQILRRTGYTVSYNKDSKVPNWVAWHLTVAHLKGTTKRSESKFHEDTDVPEPRAVDFDYVRSGYDRGHMCPAGDNKWSQSAMDESFLFSNICPQAPSLNRGDWNEMEQACRKWAKLYGDIYIVCGPIFYKKRPKTIGKNKVAVPDAFFKVVLCMKGEPKAIGFIYKNADAGSQGKNRPKGDYANSVDEVERITGIDFFPALPDKIEKKVEAQCNPNDWNL